MEGTLQGPALARVRVPVGGVERQAEPAANRSGVTAWHPTQAGAAPRDLPTPGSSGGGDKATFGPAPPAHQDSPGQSPRRTRGVAHPEEPAERRALLGLRV